MNQLLAFWGGGEVDTFHDHFIIKWDTVDISFTYYIIFSHPYSYSQPITCTSVIYTYSSITNHFYWYV